MNVRLGNWLEWSEVRGEAMDIAGHRLTPVSRSLRVAIGPGVLPAAWVFSWTRPVAVELEEAVKPGRLPIPDVNRRILLGILAAALLPALLHRLVTPRRSRVLQGGSGNE